VSDLFKDQRPELSDDEDRLLWQRVRAIPDEVDLPAPARAPWWRTLWTMPAVRYGAPAFAVLVAATVWVVERAPEPTLRVPAERARPTAAPAPAPATRQLESPPVPVVAQEKRRAASDERAAPPEVQKQNANEPQSERAQVMSAPSADAVRKEQNAARAKDSAPPPAASSPAPAPNAALKKAAPAPAFATPPASHESDGAAKTPNWGERTSNYRDSGGSGSGLAVPTAPAGSLTDRLAAGSLPEGAELRAHPLVASVAGPGSLSAIVPFPEESGLNETAKIELPAMNSTRGYREDELKFSVEYQRYARFEDAPPRLQAAVLALALERALAHPEDTSRHRIEAMLERARKVAKAADASARPGAERLVRLYEGALKGWPAR
jgi:hypothetical protein